MNTQEEADLRLYISGLVGIVPIDALRTRCVLMTSEVEREWQQWASGNSALTKAVNDVLIALGGLRVAVNESQMAESEEAE